MLTYKLPGPDQGRMEKLDLSYENWIQVFVCLPSPPPPKKEKRKKIVAIGTC